MTRLCHLFVVFLVCTLWGCEQIALMSTPAKRPEASHSSQATHAQRYFWRTLHQGRYQDIAKADYLLTAAYLKNPNDSELAAHIGFLHIWKITERQRNKQVDPLITNEIILAHKYFKDALQLDPNNAIYQGFLGDAKLVEGQIFHDDREQVEAYFQLKKAMAHWPEFNYFTAGYPMSTLPASSKYFKEALKWQWLTLDACAGKKVSRINPNFAPYMARETTQGLQRACWNSWRAPHNFEGFFMNMGDMLVKSGDWKTAIIIYNNAKLSKAYSHWPYRQVLEGKIQSAKTNIRHFQNNVNQSKHAMMFNSGYGCMACHAR